MFDLSPVVDSIKQFIKFDILYSFKDDTDELWTTFTIVGVDLVICITLTDYAIYTFNGQLLKKELLTKEESKCLMK